jgi:hypothetical protein
MLNDEENKDPIKLLKEIEAYLGFRLLADTPSVPVDCMNGIRESILKCLEANKE